MSVNNFFKASAQKSTVSNSTTFNVVKEKYSSEPWVEKYRPKKVDELVFQDEVVSVLKKCVKGADLPNLLFYGPPGTGKTSAAVALCHQLFPSSAIYKSRVLEMNASDERGIDVVRHRIKDFAHLSVSEDCRKCKAAVALKIVILDEADAMTAPAQAALRRTMESESHSTRLKMICECEKVCMSVDALDALVDISGGDLRKSITLLQSMASNAINDGSRDESGDSVDVSMRKEISAQDVREMSGYVPEAEVNALLAGAQSGNIRNLFYCVKNFSKGGYSAYQVMSQLADILLDNDALEARHKTKIFQKLGICEKRLLDGADEFLQLLDLLSVVQSCFFELDN